MAFVTYGLSLAFLPAALFGASLLIDNIVAGQSAGTSFVFNPLQWIAATFPQRGLVAGEPRKVVIRYDRVALLNRQAATIQLDTKQGESVDPLSDVAIVASSSRTPILAARVGSVQIEGPAWISLAGQKAVTVRYTACPNDELVNPTFVWKIESQGQLVPFSIVTTDGIACSGGGAQTVECAFDVSRFPQTVAVVTVTAADTLGVLDRSGKVPTAQIEVRGIRLPVKSPGHQPPRRIETPE